MGRDYKETILLPQTCFPMKAGLPLLEEKILEVWREENLAASINATNSKRPQSFILHDGPPYANGHIHMGHALNKILKDVINRGHFMLGKAVYYRPGWDCHGLPIEWQIEKNFRQQGLKKPDAKTFRRECRRYAQQWIDIQRQEFIRLGVHGDWDNPYITMTHANEATILSELYQLLQAGFVYRGERPVMWSVAEQTALAEAEIEYKEHVSTTVLAAFKCLDGGQGLRDTSVVIWTTTPWTLPANRAVAAGPDIDYVVITVQASKDDQLVRPGQKFLVAGSRLEAFYAQAGIVKAAIGDRFKGRDLEGLTLAHPLAGLGYDDRRPLVCANFVDDQSGTGFVHIAPAHGLDDFNLGKEKGIDYVLKVGADGLYDDSVPHFASLSVFDADQPILEAMRQQGSCVGIGRLRHAYPHSWRSGKPLIFRTTAQWFISMEHQGLRDKALAATKKVRWVPERGYERISSTIAERPDWCISRQRNWGVPLAIFYHRDTGEPLMDVEVLGNVLRAVEKEGGDCWFSCDRRRFLTDQYDPQVWRSVDDVLDVWFDSGCSHAYVLANDARLGRPADLYLEGSDQHRGWFQSSLVESIARHGVAPYKAVLTHGFVLDQSGRKMAKSLGNVIAPQKVIAACGADVLRLWAAMSDSSTDIRVGQKNLTLHTESYRRLRNTLRFLLGNIDHDGFAYKADNLPNMEPLDAWVLHQLWVHDQEFRSSLDDFRPYRFYQKLLLFCTSDLSAFYFDIRKDSLYCDALSSPRRQAAQGVLAMVLRYLLGWLAPIIPFTAEEAFRAWQYDRRQEAQLKPDLADRLTGQSIHLLPIKPCPKAWRDDGLATRMQSLRSWRHCVTIAIEQARNAGVVRSSSQAQVHAQADQAICKAAHGIDLADFCITGSVNLESGPEAKVTIDLADGDKCDRCWRVLPKIQDQLCQRCRQAVEDNDA